MQTRKNYRKLKMIIEDIKNSVKKALYHMDNNIIFHYESVSHTGFPYAIFSLKNFEVEHFANNNKRKLNLSFELSYQKSKENTISELMSEEQKISDALLPVINILGKKISLDNVVFKTLDKQLVMNFNLNLYTYEIDDNYELMQTLDLTMKEDKNA